MPIIKSAKKRMRQNVKRKARNFPVRSELKTLVKKQLKFISDGKVEEAVKLMPAVYSIIDKACKKKIIHPNNAARKKSRLATALNGMQEKVSEKKVEKVAEKK
jgi:small subunit ribosomal protein S20